MLRSRTRVAIFAVALGLAVSVPAQPVPAIAGGGPAADRAAVAAVLGDYLAVTDRRDESAIRRAFDAGATLMSVSRAGALNLLSQSAWWDRVSAIPADTPTRRSTIALIDVTGVGATARVDIQNSATGTVTTDYFLLQKLRSGWRIVAKGLSVPL